MQEYLKQEREQAWRIELREKIKNKERVITSYSIHYTKLYEAQNIIGTCHLQSKKILD